jgi:type VI secretion system protein ImpK
MNELARQRQDLPLKHAFCQVWEEWLLLGPALLSSAEPAASLQMRVVEESSILARRVYRSVIAQAGGAGKQQAQAVQYAFVALLDEQLLFTDWSGQSGWQSTPLEFRLFGSRTAGEALPDEIERVLAEQLAPERDLAAVYLMALVLGFRGRLRRDPGHYEHCCTSLFAQVYQREPGLKMLEQVLEGDSLGKPLQFSERKMLPDGYRLALTLLLMLLLMLGISQLFWHDIYQHIDLSHPPLSEAKP